MRRLTIDFPQEADLQHAAMRLESNGHAEVAGLASILTQGPCGNAARFEISGGTGIPAEQVSAIAPTTQEPAQDARAL